jgi:CBS domain-containing protein
MRLKGMMRDSWGKAKALHLAFDEFQTSWHNFTATEEVTRWFEEWRQHMVEPDLGSVVGHDGFPAVGVRTNVMEAAKLMKDSKQTAVLVMSSQELRAADLVGIFTTKDIVLRLVADGNLDAKATSIVRVMTPHPDRCRETMSVYEALEKMERGRYLHLPVVNKDEDYVVGMVDVLSLTYFVMEQLLKQRELRPSQSTTSSAAQPQGTDPIWSTFWDASNTIQQADLASVSSSSAPAPSTAVPVPASPSLASQTTVMPQTGFVFKFKDPFMRDRSDLPVVHRFMAKPSLVDVYQQVCQKMGCEIVFTNDGGYVDMLDMDTSSQKVIEKSLSSHGAIKVKPMTPPMVVGEAVSPVLLSAQAGYDLSLFYRDDEGDFIPLSSDDDVKEAIALAKTMGWTRLNLGCRVIVDDGDVEMVVTDVVPRSSSAHVNFPGKRDIIKMSLMGAAGAVLGAVVVGAFLLRRTKQ